MKRVLISLVMMFSIIPCLFSFMSSSSAPLPGQQPSLKASMDRGKKVYETYCLSCHMQDGLGVTHMNPPLVKTPFVLGDKKKLIGIVLNGLADPIEIEGDTFSNIMAAHDYLEDQQIADVLTYVRNSWGNKAAAVTAQDVKAARAENKK